MLTNMTAVSPLPPRITRESAREVATTLREVADALDALADEPPSDDPDGSGWGLRAADLGLTAMAAGEVMADSGMAVAALEGDSLRRIGEAVGFSFSAIPRRLAGTPELGDYAEEARGGHRRVTQGGIERAKFDLRHNQFTVEGEVERVQRRRRG